MSYLVLARKYRPQSFEQVIDQAHVTRTLSNAIATDRMAHAVLFSGPRGTGKTTVARILAKAMNCGQGPTPTPCNQCRSCREITRGHAADVFEIDGASNNSVEQVRDLRENVKYMPAHSAYKIYIIDEVHMLSTAAFNALLKTLEEPPEHVMFIFATTEPHKIPVTIHSRCQRHDFRRIDMDATIAHMQAICENEHLQIDPDSLNLVAREAGGSMRDALSLLDQIMACVSGQVRYEQVVDLLGVVDNKQVFDLTAALLASDVPGILKILDGIYDRGIDMKRLYNDLVVHFRNLVLIKMGVERQQLLDLPAQDVSQMTELVQHVSAAYLHQVFDMLFQQEPAIKYSSHPKLALEMIFMRLFQIQPALPIDALIDKLDLLRHEVAAHGPGQAPSQHSEIAHQPSEAVSDDPGSQSPVGSSTEQSAAAREQTDLEAALQPGPVAGNPDETWQRIRETVSQTNPSLAAALVNSRIKNVSDRQLDIEVQANEFQLSIIRRDKNRSALTNACREAFGRELQIAILPIAPPDPASPKKKKDVDELKREALNHPLVAEALNLFKGRLVDVKVLKEEKL